MYRAIMVPLDGSSFGEHALPLALNIARRSGAALHLVHTHVVHDRRAPDSLPDDRQRQHEDDYLAAIARRLGAAWHGPIETALLDGEVVEAIASYSESHHIDLAVITTHGRGALSRAWLGSNADRLLHRLSMPLIMIRPHETDLADFTRPPRIQRILIPLDGSELSETIIPYALALGRLTDATFILLQTIELLLASSELGTSALNERDVDAWINETQQYLDGVIARLSAEGVSVESAVIMGSPSFVILEYAREHAIDLIALETHGRSGAARFFLGSIADKIIRGATTPVLLHHPHVDS